jgi:hypothetical protein
MKSNKAARRLLNTAKTFSPEEFNRLEYSGKFLIILRSSDMLPLL